MLHSQLLEPLPYTQTKTKVIFCEFPFCTPKGLQYRQRGVHQENNLEWSSEPLAVSVKYEVSYTIIKERYDELSKEGG